MLNAIGRIRMGAIIPLSAAVLLFFLLAPGSASACGFFSNCKPKSTDANVTAQLEQLIAQGDREVGLPGIVNFFEKRQMRTIYELRDNPEFRTYTYWTTMDGGYVFVCDSIGFGMNASVQFSNPQRLFQNSNIDRAATFIPQAEPNALFMPEGLAATYVMCLDPTTINNPEPEVTVVYAEQDIFVSPFPIPGAINPWETAQQ